MSVSPDLHALATRLSCPLFDIDRLHALAPDFNAMPYPDAQARHCIALIDDRNLYLVTEEPFRDGFLAWADFRLNRPFRLALAARGDIAAILARHGEQMKALDAESMRPRQDGATQDGIEVLDLASIQGDARPIVRLVNSTLYDAYRAGASDIHLESRADGLCVKYRLDGVLTVAAELSGIVQAEQAISRLKVMAELDIAERRVPQDGRIKIRIGDREIDLRVSIMPSIHGEDAVLRILDKHALTDQVRRLTLDFLGFEQETIHLIRRLAKEPHGMLLVTGPTGSGKTTTLYAVIGEINDGRDKIVTIEDPVEYQLADVLQIPVNEKKGLTFARGLRSILRHDPDKIMVGEIRDEETAQIAVQSALTGHLVLTTVHANNAFDVVSRFLHMSVAPHAFASAINGVVAQRLIRVNCPECTVETSPSPEMLMDSGVSMEAARQFDFRKGRGCGHCRGTGYKGRRAVAEVLKLTGDMRELIVAGGSSQRLMALADQQGMTPIRDIALAMVKRGETTLEEINRVTFVA